MVTAGLYVHWPWCVHKCPYCDFNSFVSRTPIPEAQYVQTLLRDLEAAVRVAPQRRIDTIYLGGGTPSLMSAQGVESLLVGIRSRVEVAPDAEISMEANPGTVEASRFAGYVQAGVNRFSLGIQSFHDEELRRLGRIHNRAQALAAIAAAKAVCDNVNLDVMYCLPGEGSSMLEEDLKEAIAQATTHLSFYELTLEEGTTFYKQPPKGLPDPDAAADLDDLVHERLSQAGFIHYEVSGYARPGKFCRHNRNYWTFGDYFGIGAGAHGKVTVQGQVIRTVRQANPRLYLQDAAAGKFEAVHRVVPKEELPFEFMLNALRLLEGVPAQRWEETTGLPLSYIAAPLQKLRSQGLLVADPDRIAATALGLRFLTDVQEAFLA